MTALRVLMVGDSLDQRGGIATLQKMHLAGAPEDVVTEHVTTHTEGSRVHRTFVFVVGLARILWRLSRRTVDLLHVHQSGGGSLVRKAIVIRVASAWSVPIVLHGHAGRSDTTLDALPAPLRRFVVSSLGRVGGVIALSRVWERWYHVSLGIPEHRIHTVHNPAPEIRNGLSPNDPSDGLVRVLSVSRLREEKGIFDLVRAYAQLDAETRARTELILTGDGELDELRGLVADLGVGDSVRMTGWLEGEQLESVVRSADIVMVPGPDEGLPLALLEAMAHGKATVSVAVGGALEIVDHGHNGLLVPPRSPSAMCASLTELIVSSDLRETLGERARETSRANTVAHYWAAILDVYDVARQPNEQVPDDATKGQNQGVEHRNRPLGVSIVVPTFNRSRWLGDALSTLSAQELQNGLDLKLEVIVVDNASTDDTKQVVAEAATTSEVPVEYVFEAVQGDGAARNAGLAAASHQLIAFFDDDQLADERWILELVDVLESTGAMIVGGAVNLALSPDEAAQFGGVTRRDMLRESIPYTKVQRYEPGSLPGTCNLLVDRGVFEDIGVFDAELNGGSDFDFLRRAIRGGYVLWHAPSAVVTHRVSAYRRSTAYFRREASRNGWTLAEETLVGAGVAALVAECGVRLIQTTVITVPKLAIASLSRDRAEVCDRNVLRWRAEGFVRRTVHAVAPWLWPQHEFIASHQFAGHESQQLAAESSTGHP